MVEKIIGVVAAIVIGMAQLTYLIDTIRKKIKPSVLSWLGWALLMGTSVASQVATKGWQWSQASVLFSAF
ncbi:MAG TPA: hypothetical protein VGQ51_02170 [Puia sp.]|nr:hypothetical protein [Puia sp.]